MTCCSVFNVWPKTTLLRPVWPRDVRRLDIPMRMEKKRNRLYPRDSSRSQPLVLASENSFHTVDLQN